VELIGKEETMETQLFYVFIPTRTLVEVAKSAGQEYLTEVGVWIDKAHDRIGKEHGQKELELAFWSLFLANLIGENPEPRKLRHMRETCLELGFENCWTVVCTTSGGGVADLLSEASEANSFLHQHDLVVK
jgi:hypothetical protein